MFYKILINIILFMISLNASNDVKNLKSFKANFVQTITSATNNTINYEGELFIKSTGKILWKYKKPVIKNIYIDKDVAIVEEPEFEQVIITKLNDEINILSLLNKSQKINSNTYIANIDEINYNLKIDNNGAIKEITYKDKLENNVLIKFFNSKQNQKIEDYIFKINIPNNYDVIRK